MKRSMNPIEAAPIFKLGSRPDILLAVGVCFIASMMVVPLPPVVLDVLISLNISFSILLLISALFSSSALKISSFPSLLLLTTLFRLGLNVSTTRGILAKADAGDVVRAFGGFVVQGDLVVGLVIFLVITLVQFLVIAKGAERVAEVAARFTLDAMPGKQMSIDAALRAGSITDIEAQTRRDRLGRESQLFGNMDGAMKFVKGDAVAGLIITALNLVAGLIIGVVRLNMSATQALELYSTLTVGDGLVAQIAAFIVTLAAGILVTRVSEGDSSEKSAHEQSLGFSLKEEIFGNPTVLFVAGGIMLLMALVPGMPGGPFALAALIVSLIGFGRSAYLQDLAGLSTTSELSTDDAIERRIEQVKRQKAITDQIAPSVTPVTLELGSGLSAALGFTRGGAAEDTELLASCLPQLRDALYLETGVRFPGVFVRADTRDLPPGGLRIRINDVPIVEDVVPVDKALAVTPPRDLLRLGVTGDVARHPIRGVQGVWVDPVDREVLEASGVVVWNLSGLVALHLGAVLRKRGAQFVGLQEACELIERMEKAFPALVREVVPRVIPVRQLVGVLRRLVDEDVNIRDMKTILGALGEHGSPDDDVIRLTEIARTALGQQLAFAYGTADHSLPALLLDPLIEDTIESAVRRTDYGESLALDPEITRSIIAAIKRGLKPVLESGARPTILTSAKIRRLVRKLIEVELAPVPVLSFEELPLDMIVNPVGTAHLVD